MNIDMQVSGKDASFDSEQVLSYGSKEAFIEAMGHVFNHVSEEEQKTALSSVYDKAVAAEYPDHESVDENQETEEIAQVLPEQEDVPRETEDLDAE